MAGKTVLDTFPQFAVLTVAAVTSAGVSAVASNRLVTGLTALQKVGWILQRIQYWIAPELMASLQTPLDYRALGILQSSALSPGLTPVNASVIDSIRLDIAIAAAAGFTIPAKTEFPITKDFPGGILILPQNLYFMSETYDASSTGPYTCYARLWYTETELGDADYYDLLQLRTPLGV